MNVNLPKKSPLVAVGVPRMRRDGKTYRTLGMVDMTPAWETEDFFRAYEKELEKIKQQK